jgi:hypothetical protein
MAVEHPRVAAAQPSTPIPVPLTGTTFEERWAAWEAKGAAHDRALRRKLALAAPIAIVVVAITLFALLR